MLIYFRIIFVLHETIEFLKVIDDAHTLDKVDFNG